LSKRQHALTTAWCIRHENKLMGVLSPAAFLVEIGKVLISQQIIADKSQEAFRDALKESQNVEESERKIVGADTAEVSSSIFEHWRFEESLVDVIRNCLHPQEAQPELQRSAQILHVVRTSLQINGQTTDATIAEAKKLIEQYGLDLPSYEKALEHINDSE
ncbi:MAG: HDOD domain-containing protein, partial [Thiovulaceae bacterium]|nr:HDOD domain-containing protein [Sulfurimonadaceae bacterium]